MPHELSEDLREAVLRVYHGTRAPDVSVFYTEGLRVHDNVEMTRRLRLLAGLPDELGEARDELDRAIAVIGNTHDIGRLQSLPTSGRSCANRRTT